MPPIKPVTSIRPKNSPLRSFAPYSVRKRRNSALVSARRKFHVWKKAKEMTSLPIEEMYAHEVPTSFCENHQKYEYYRPILIRDDSLGALGNTTRTAISSSYVTDYC